MSYGALRALEKDAAKRGNYRYYAVDCSRLWTEWAIRASRAERNKMPFGEDPPDTRNALSPWWAEMFRNKGWHPISIRNVSGYLGTRFFRILTPLASTVQGLWTIIPIESDWTVVIGFEDATNLEPFRAAFADKGLLA